MSNPWQSEDEPRCEHTKAEHREIAIQTFTDQVGEPHSDTVQRALYGASQVTPKALAEVKETLDDLRKDESVDEAVRGIANTHHEVVSFALMVIESPAPAEA